MSFGNKRALNAYQTMGAHSQVAAADPYRLVQLLFEKAVEGIAAARGHLERGEHARKGEQISKAIGIVSELDASLNVEQGGDVAANLHALYQYMLVRLTCANAENDVAALDEVGDLLRNIKSGWDGIAPPPAQGSAPAHAAAGLP